MVLLVCAATALAGYVSSRGDGAQAFAAVLWQCFDACTKLEKLPRRVYSLVDAALKAGDETKSRCTAASKAPPGARGVRSGRKECFQGEFGPAL